MSFDNVRVSSIRITNSPLSGSVLITVSGTGFGYADFSNKLRIGWSVPSCSIWKSDSAIVAKTDSGSRSSLHVIILGEIRSSSFTRLLSYDAAVVSSVSAAGATTGSHDVNSFGIAYASVVLSAAIRIANSASSSLHWISDSSVRCMLVSGESAWFISCTCFGRSNSRYCHCSVFFSFTWRHGDYCDKSCLVWCPVRVFTGVAFWSIDFSARAVLGRTSSSVTVWQADSSVTVKIA